MEISAVTPPGTRCISPQSPSAVLIRFDEVDHWAPALTAALTPHVPRSVKDEIRRANPEYIEDAADLVLDLCSRDVIVGAALAWIRSIAIAGYHGTRLTDAEVAAVRAEGLVPLSPRLRRARLERALSAHPRWPEVGLRLDSEIESYGTQAAGGRRDGQAHLTLSRAGLVKSFNHYLTYGSEFDQCVARALLNDEGLALLAEDGDARMIEFSVPGAAALNAAHPYFSAEDLLGRRELPNIVREFIQVWSFRQARATYQCRTLTLDCGMIFRSTVPSDWIVTIDTLTD